MIRTYEELAALPEETLILDVTGFMWERAVLATEYAVEYGADTVLPATPLIPATISREKLDELGGRLNIADWDEKEIVEEVLHGLGIEVGDE